jgi:hypothetical protein
VEAVATLARRTVRFLRVHVEIFSPDTATRESVAVALRNRGFRQSEDPRSYTSTVAVDLLPDEQTIFNSFQSKTRRDIRAGTKGPVVVKLIESTEWVDRIAALHQETMKRTGGTCSQRDWKTCIELSRSAPSLSRLVGLFHTSRTDPGSLLAFAWACQHGDYAHYDAAASTRNTDLKHPMAYPLVWDLLCWARQQGATWFDFGGITRGTLGSDDRLGGISDFKRYFSKTIIKVGEEWVLEPHWTQARLANLVHTGKEWANLLCKAFSRSAAVGR